MIIAINGAIGSGKDTFCELFAKNSKRFYQNKKFAYKLKVIVSLLTGCKVEDLESEEFKNSYLPEEFNIEKCTEFHGHSSYCRTTRFTYRELLQKLGTDLLRDGFHPNVHINALFADYVPYEQEKFLEPDKGWASDGAYNCICIKCKKNHLGYKRQLRCKECIIADGPIYPNWMITDMRFKNEFDESKSRGAVTIRVERFMKVSEWLNSKYFQGISFTTQGFQELIDNDEKVSKTFLITKILSNFEFYLTAAKDDKNWQKLIHQSENDLNIYVDKGKFDYVVNNDGTLEDFENKIKEIIKQIDENAN